MSTANKNRFNLESEMASSVIRWMARRGLTVKPEFALPWGVCDLVAVKLDPVRVRLRLSYGQTRSVGPPVRLHILSRIPEADTGRSISFRKLNEDMADILPPDALSRELTLLAGGRFVTSPRLGFFQKINGWAPLHLKIVAVELKLSRVSEALGQAAANRLFATDSYVALPGGLALRVGMSERARNFKLQGIGLLAVWHHGCRELLKPSTKDALRSEVVQSHVVERFWRTRDN